MRIFFILLLTLILVSVPAFFLLFTPEVLSSEEEVSEEVALEPQAMNIVVFMTTDQRWDSIGNNQVNVDINAQFGRNVMPNVQSKLIDQGVIFSEAYVTTPLASPVRASILSGGYLAQNTGVLTNESPNGGVNRFRDKDTISTSLQNAGYKTGFVGAYLSEYADKDNYIPPGWSSFYAVKEVSNWNNYSLVYGSSGSEATKGQATQESNYVINRKAELALDFIDKANGEPYLLLFSTDTPRYPATPALGDESLYDGYLYRERSYAENNVADKPAWAEDQANKRFSTLKDSRDDFHLNQLRSLNSVDQAIGDIIDKVADQGQLENTVFIFTSTNGYLWGEHKLWGKNAPYDEALHVPLVLVHPGIVPGQVDELVAANLDVGATILGAAGIGKETDGRNLLTYLNGQRDDWREQIFIESFHPEHGFAGFKSKNYAYIEYISGENEYYDYTVDPLAKSNIAGSAEYDEIISLLQVSLEPEKGTFITNSSIPLAAPGTMYSADFSIWGTPPFAYYLYEGSIPPGFNLDADNGVISGQVTTDLRQNISIKAGSAKIAAHSGWPQTHIREYILASGDSVGSSLTHGPMIGAVTESSVRIWLRIEPGASAQIQYTADPELDSGWQWSGAITTGAEKDYAGIISLNGLESDTEYYYRIFINGEEYKNTNELKFRTFPRYGEELTLGIIADAAADPNVSAPAVISLSRENPDILLMIGDMDHGNPASLGEYRAMHKANRSNEKQVGAVLKDYLLYNTPVAYVWDDHDYGENQGDKNTKSKKDALRAYKEYWPSYDLAREEEGIWQNFKYGNLAEVFVLDVRSQRDADTYKDPAFIPDTEARSNRDTLRFNTCRSMLDGNLCPGGLPTGQKEWLKDALWYSNARWKIIVTPVTWNPTTEKDDAWWDFRAERLELMAYLKSRGISGVIFVSADLHTGGAIDDGTYSGYPEMSVPDLNLGGAEVACRLHNPGRESDCGNWSHGIVADGSGYGLITLTPERAIVSAKNTFGQDTTGVMSLVINYSGGLFTSLSANVANKSLSVVNRGNNLEGLSEMTDRFYSNGIVAPVQAPTTALIDISLSQERVRLTVKNKKMYQNLQGRIMLTVEQNGEAYYVHPDNETIYFLGRPGDAFAVMREQGVGITNANLMKIPVGFGSATGLDTDGDGLSDMLEDALGTNSNLVDTDNDGHSDKSEMEGGFNPLLPNVNLGFSKWFTSLQLGKIFLQVEQNGEAWYINPADSKRYFLGRPADAFAVMRNLGLGISNKDFSSLSE
ncbi:sulfatase-like hydrolase/transferase [Candidatus Parcubacteria bacterium]|nr:sulfatase-like hydrolase/transferase [Candidatus Parcubacteria bacterium]